MRIKDTQDPEVIRFLRYNFERENILRLAWLQNNQNKVKKACVLSREPKNSYEIDDIAFTIACGIENLKNHLKDVPNFRRKTPLRDGRYIPGVKDLKKGHSILDLGLGDPNEDPRLARPDKDLSMDPVMRPVDLEITDILYKPKDTLGRVKYLKKRSVLPPDMKYYMPECSYWEHGWKVNESPLLVKSHFGKFSHLIRDISRTGAHPDPQHYTARRGSFKCIQSM